MVKSKIACG